MSECPRCSTCRRNRTGQSCGFCGKPVCVKCGNVLASFNICPACVKLPGKKLAEMLGERNAESVRR